MVTIDGKYLFVAVNRVAHRNYSQIPLSCREKIKALTGCFLFEVIIFSGMPLLKLQPFSWPTKFIMEIRLYWKNIYVFFHPADVLNPSHYLWI